MRWDEFRREVTRLRFRIWGKMAGWSDWTRSIERRVDHFAPELKESSQGNVYRRKLSMLTFDYYYHMVVLIHVQQN